jgi:hypothetical protein
LIGLGLGVARHHQFTAIGQRHMHIEHQHAREGFQHGARSQSGRVDLEPFAQRDTQAVNQKAHQNMRLDAHLDVVADGAQVQIAFERLEPVQFVKRRALPNELALGCSRRVQL